MSSYRLKNGTVRTGSVAQYGRANRAIWDPKVSLGGVEWARGGVGWRLLDVVVGQPPPYTRPPFFSRIEFGWEFRVLPVQGVSELTCTNARPGRPKGNREAVQGIVRYAEHRRRPP